MPHFPRNVQSGYFDTDFWAQWDSTTPRMCVCLKITSRAEFGSTVLGFTSNTRNMTLPGHPGVTFQSTPGLAPSAIEMALDEPVNLEAMGLYQTGAFTQSDIAAGKWDFAEVEMMCVSWQNVNLGEFVMVRGNIGEIKDRQTYFTAEVRGPISRLARDVHSETSRFCRAPYFGDPVYCKKNLATTVTISGTAYNITHTGVKTIAVSFEPTDAFITINTSLFTGNVPPAGFFANGRMTMTSGTNSGLSREIAYNEAASGGQMQFQLKRSFPFTIAGNSDTFTLVAGCDHTLEMCILYGNVINRRAEDWVPGLETIHRLPTK